MSDTSIGSFNTEDSLAQMNQGGGRDRWLTPRSIGLSLILVGVFAYFLPHLYLKWSLRVHAGGYLPVIAVFPFLILMALNALVRRVGLGLSRGEITVVFCAMMVSLSTLLTIMMLFTILPAPVRGATPGNKFEQLFLWSADSRILPYTMEDKEREKTASQFQESLNWYYMGVPKPPAKEVELRYDPGQAWWLSTRAAVGAVAPLSPAPQATTTRIELEVPPLQTPWWRWIRKHAVDRDARMRAYEALADQIQRTEGLDPALAKEMLAEVAVLRTNVGWIQSPDALVYDKIPFHGTYGTMLRRLGESKTLGPIAWRELRLAVEHQQDIDVEWPWWRWGDSHGLERAAPDGLSGAARAPQPGEGTQRRGAAGPARGGSARTEDRPGSLAIRLAQRVWPGTALGVRDAGGEDQERQVARSPDR